MTEPRPIESIPPEPIPRPIELRLAFRDGTSEADFRELISNLNRSRGRLCVLYGYEYSRAGTITLTLLPPATAEAFPEVINEGIRSFFDEQPKETDDAK